MVANTSIGSPAAKLLTAKLLIARGHLRKTEDAICTSTLRIIHPAQGQQLRSPWTLRRVTELLKQVIAKRVCGEPSLKLGMRLPPCWCRLQLCAGEYNAVIHKRVVIYSCCRITWQMS